MKGSSLLAGAGLGAVAGLALGAGWAAREIGGQGYLALGWVRLSLLAVVDAAGAGVLLGATAGAALVLVGWLVPLAPVRGWTARQARRGRAGAIALAVTLALTAAGEVGVAVDRAVARPAGPSVLVVVIDSLRVDHVGSYGHSEDTTPHLDALAAAGSRYTTAYSTAPWTTPSVASMFTGRHPTALGIVDRATALAPGLPTLAERMRQAGYRTGAVVSHCLLAADLGFDQGFERFDEVVGEVDGTTSPEATDRALRFLRRHGDEPFLLFVHYFDPHYDYVEHPEHVFGTGYEGPLHSGQRIFDQRELAPTLTATDREYLVGLYDSEIRHNDMQLGRLLDALEDEGRLDETLVVVTSDHGEAFLERGDPWIGHSRTVFDELIHVPLVVRWPGQTRAEVIDTPVSLVSLHPTVARESGLADSPQLPPAIPTWREPGPVEPLLFAETHKEGYRAAVVRWPWKLIADESSGEEHLYALDRDPGEELDLASARPDIRAQLATQLQSWRRRSSADGIDPESVRPRLDAGQEERLRALGYL